MADFTKIARRMKEDWNRRVDHDYRFWMSDGHTDDAAMWESGERDFQIVCSGIQNQSEKAILELGCGVGRLLKPALSRFKRVIGFDVSSSAIEKARQLLGNSTKLELYVGNGFDLQPVADASVDVGFSYAAITSMPTDVIANYLRELHRVIKPGGQCRLQMYAGNEYRVCQDDTLHLRCYAESNLRKALELAGFKIEGLEELVLPIKVSFEELGIKAMIVSLERLAVEPANIGAISNALLPGGEIEVIVEKGPNELEYWTALNYAQDLLKAGDVSRAREAVEYAVRHNQNATIDTRDMLERIIKEIEQREGTGASAVSADYWTHNLNALHRRFPEVWSRMKDFETANISSCEIRSTGDGPVIWFKGQCLDHPSKPRSGAEVWVKRVLQEKRFDNCSAIAVCGFGAGYHIESLQQLSSKPVLVIEPSPEVFASALRCRDLGPLIDKLHSLYIGPDLPQGVFDRTTELVVRPQELSGSPMFCSDLKSQFYGMRGISTLHPKLAVLGPIQGGTLPMTNYCSRAFALLQQRVREFDMSGYAQGFHIPAKLMTSKLRHQSLQGVYLEMISQVILEALTEKPADILVCMAQAPISGRVLTELRKRGVITVLWFVEDYLRFGYWKEMAKFYDFIFTIQRGKCIEEIRKAGCPEVHYLPVACDPIVHRPVILSEEEKARWGSPISFVGAGYHNRQQVFASFADMPLKLWGTEWPECRPFDRLVQEKGRRLTPEEYIKIFNASEININLHSSDERDGVDPFGDFVNPRTFELAAAGAFQLVDQRSLLSECFEPGKEVITFSNPRELKQQIAHYLEHPEERGQVVEAARARVLRDHTYQARMQQMLSIIYSSRFEQLKRREDESPWQRMLDRAKPHEELFLRCKAAFDRGEEPILDGLVADIVCGKGKLSETEQKLMFLFHVRKQIMRMRSEEMGKKA